MSESGDGETAPLGPYSVHMKHPDGSKTSPRTSNKLITHSMAKDII